MITLHVEQVLNARHPALVDTEQILDAADPKWERSPFGQAD
jgi:hypothetical protein